MESEVAAGRDSKRGPDHKSPGQSLLPWRSLRFFALSGEIDVSLIQDRFLAKTLRTAKNAKKNLGGSCPASAFDKD
jgi:hypothetical protein